MESMTTRVPIIIFFDVDQLTGDDQYRCSNVGEVIQWVPMLKQCVQMRL